MKVLTALLPLLLAARAFAGDVATHGATADEPAADCPSLPDRTHLPRGGPRRPRRGHQGASQREQRLVGVHWIKSFANADRTKTFCVYEGPSEDAIRQAAALNNLPVDSITEVPVDLTP